MPILDHRTTLQQAMGKEKAPLPGAFQNVPLLLVEDDRDMAVEVTKELTNLGYHVRVAETEAEGLPRPACIRPRSLIVDRMLRG